MRYSAIHNTGIVSNDMKEDTAVNIFCEFFNVKNVLQINIDNCSQFRSCLLLAKLFDVKAADFRTSSIQYSLIVC